MESVKKTLILGKFRKVVNSFFAVRTYNPPKFMDFVDHINVDSVRVYKHNNKYEVLFDITINKPNDHRGAYYVKKMFSMYYSTTFIIPKMFREFELYFISPSCNSIICKFGKIKVNLLSN